MLYTVTNIKSMQSKYQLRFNNLMNVAEKFMNEVSSSLPSKYTWWKETLIKILLGFRSYSFNWWIWDGYHLIDDSLRSNIWRHISLTKKCILESNQIFQYFQNSCEWYILNSISCYTQICICFIGGDNCVRSLVCPIVLYQSTRHILNILREKYK